MIPKIPSTLMFFVNGQKVIDQNVDPEVTLLTYLRNKLKLCGTKLGCSEGGCGACTVMLSKFDRQKKKIVNLAVNACLTPICVVHGMAITTVEGIGSVSKGLHPVQERIAKTHGSQCGFCTPGIVMSMYTLIRNNSLPSMEDVETAFQGNLCRCTGYRPILEGYKTFTKEGCCGAKENCCKLANGSVTNGNNRCTENGNGSASKPGEHGELYSPSEFKPLDPDSEPIFPPELQLESMYDEMFLKFETSRVKWFRPTSMEQVLELKNIYSDAKLLVGNTEIGIEIKYKNQQYPVIIQLTHVPELNDISYEEPGIRFGSSVTLTKMEEILQEEISTQPEYKTRIFSAINEMLRWFAGKQVRNVAAIGGNIVTGSPISDLNPLFMAANCELQLKSKDGTRYVKMDENFFTGYRTTILNRDEVLTSIFIPYTETNEYFMGYKQSKRRDDDIAIVNAGIYAQFKPQSNQLKNIRLAYGGMAPTSVFARKTASALIGLSWNDELLTTGNKMLIEDLPLEPGAPGGMEKYRQALALSFFFKFFMTVKDQLNQSITSEPLADRFKSGTQLFHRSSPHGFQLSQIVPPDQPDYDTIGRPIPHLSAFQQSTGEAVYTDDLPKFEDELYLAFVLSTKAHAKIVGIDATNALSQDGVTNFLCAKDLGDKNDYFATCLKDEQVFASEKVTCVGQIIGAVLATDQAIAQRAAKLVKVEYEEISPVIITIEDAIKHESYYMDKNTFQCGDIHKGFEEADGIVEGEMHVGGQEHFYLETQAVLAVPREDELEIFSSTQKQADMQHTIGVCLGIPDHKIVVRTKRVGGGFGGKETRACVVAVPCAIAAYKFRRPIRCMLDRDEDMIITGTRHPFLCKYKAGYKSNGKITALQMDMYANCGHTVDVSPYVIEAALFQADNGYKMDNIQVNGYCCKTNLASNTAFRGFGAPQAAIVGENIITHIAHKLNLDHLKVREINMYKEGDLTHYLQPLNNCTLNRCWSECLENSNYMSRRKEIDEFNKVHRWKKRGLVMVPNKFTIGYPENHLNQAGALLIVYKDGSVLLHHGGVEIGQGINTKMIQVASRVLKIPPEKIITMDCSTDKVPNTSSTAASVTSDLNGGAVLNACEKIMRRLDPFIKANPKGNWNEWVKAAYLERISLSATGFYCSPKFTFDRKTNTGADIANYFSYGAACAEVEIDCLTGDHNVRRVDIVMDVGESLNPAIDIGQIEGAFMQGYGLYTLEEHHYSPDGVLLTRGPSTYKIPGFGDVPQIFNVALLRGAPNPRAVFSSKAIGEPPLLLATSVFYAIKDAIKAAREEQGLSSSFRLDSPATAERIRLACEDDITAKICTPAPGSFKPWSVIA